ncbi:hypothetical protein J2X65_003165 [Ancylobacter sp. 3268]|uniref:hypothetical protein n=1 Tax=Ancylobacter sp. 3268 TaxID=2817752 RepID=UPI00285FF555|nr:hypothetical protein [Ancylobacter sp. 3268]MDR6953802.1 hypothetical protein [Ancylobacter sp. 3268]
MGKRTPSGKLSESTDERAKRGLGDVRSVVMSQPHRAGLGKDRRMDQRAATAIGRLFMTGRIDEAEYWAAERWFRLIGEFHQIMATPITTTTVLGTMAAGDRGDRDGDVGAAERPETEEERRERVLGHHGSAMNILRGTSDHRAVFRTLEAVVLYDCPIGGEAELIVLKEGLSALARFWRLRSPPKADEELPVRVAGHRYDRPVWPHEERIVNIVAHDASDPEPALDKSG